ncbi:MAG: DUF3618 domain-containing protein [Burkholderiales bacterium]|jgi:hypothetical protein
MRTPEEIEAEIDRVRDRMDATLTDLEFRLTPRELLRDGINSLSSLQGSRYVGRYVGKLMHMGRRYPKPAAIAGASLAGLLLAGRRYKTQHSDDQKSSDRLSQAMDAARETMQDTKQTLAKGAGTAKDKLVGATSSAMERASDLAGSAGKRLREAGSSVHSVTRERPVAAGAVALALAAAVLMSIPSVRRKLY